MQMALFYAFAFFSGSAAFVYQVAWSKALSLTFSELDAETAEQLRELGYIR